MSQPWNYNETSDFVTSADSLGLTDDFREKIKSWSITVGQTPTPRLKPYFIHPKNTFQIWVAGLPNPDSNKGKSGGFRLVYALNIQENSIHLFKIETRDQLGFKDEGKRRKEKNDDYLDDLKKYLLNEWC